MFNLRPARTSPHVTEARAGSRNKGRCGTPVIGIRNNTVSLIDTYNKLMAYKRIGKARRKAQERVERGTGGPMDPDRRRMVYAAQRDGGAMTPRQARRFAQKLAKHLLAGVGA